METNQAVPQATPDAPKRDFVAELRAMKEAGLEFGHCTAVFGESSDSNPFVKAARSELQKDGEVEIDDPAVVSQADDADGAYVMAWVWVSKEMAGIPDSDDVIYIASDQPFTCVACGTRTEHEGVTYENGRWIEVCPACGKTHLVEDEKAEDAEPANFRNFYACPKCGHEWEDVWSATCDDDCPACGARHISPARSEDA